MAVIIGAATTVSFNSSCVISANWTFAPNPQRFHCLDGSWEPAFTRYKPVETMSLTVYADAAQSGGPSLSVEADESCVALGGDVTATISPANCGGGAGTDPTSSNWYVTSYSYSKDDGALPGQESWSLQQWVTGVGLPSVALPTYVIRGISEGTATTYGGTDKAGIVFTGTTAIGSTGSVSAGALGKADEMAAGVVSDVGGPTAAAGEIATGNASIPYTPLYI